MYALHLLFWNMLYCSPFVFYYFCSWPCSKSALTWTTWNDHQTWQFVILYPHLVSCLLSPTVAWHAHMEQWQRQSLLVHKCNGGEKEASPTTLPLHIMWIMTACCLTVFFFCFLCTKRSCVTLSVLIFWDCCFACTLICGITPSTS